MSDLHTRLRAAIQEKLDLAKPIANEWVSQMPTIYMDGHSNGAIRPSGGGPFVIQGTFAPGVDRFITAHDPATAIRLHEAALRVLERHRPANGMAQNDDDGDYCSWCSQLNQIGYPNPCAEIRDLASAYGHDA